ncbi:MAG: chemotaxis protein CheD [Gammaproteobacteria bacterium]|nr:chemotaxis protein CheD [Gammaproteobacteria bacterium]MDH5730593.1 chemotaxis protein CheD [Gammaproteobacteria bacterium]
MAQVQKVNPSAPEEGDALYLMVGDIYFGDGYRMLKTLLGSCIAVTLWHKERKLGGMCHIQLPNSHDASEEAKADSNRYADNAIHTFLKYIKQKDTVPKEYRVGLYGGGKMFSTVNNQGNADIGLRNADATRNLLKQYGFRIFAEDVGEPKYRHIHLDLANGHVSVNSTAVDDTMG